MKRPFFVSVVLVALVLFFMQSASYYSMVRSSRLAHPSHEKQEIVPYSFHAEIMDKQGQKMIVKVVDGDWRGRQIVLKLSREENRDFLEATTISVLVNKNEKQFVSSKNDAFDYDKYLYSQGCTGVYKVLDIEVVGTGFSYYKLKRNVRAAVGNRIERHALGSLLSALVLGEKNDYEWYERMKGLGISHLLVISGLHFAIMHRFVLFLLHPLKKERVRTMLVLLVISVMFFVVQPSYSAMRAYITVMYCEVAKLLDRKVDVLTTQAFALLCILICTPSAVLSGGLYLSFYLYLSIVFVYRKLSKNIGIPLWDMFRFSVYIQFVTAPVLLFLFGRLNLLSALANVLVVPLFGIVVPFAFATLTFCAIPFLGNVLVFCWQVLTWAVGNLVAISPLYTVNMGMRGFEWMLLGVAILILPYVFPSLRVRQKERYTIYVLSFVLCFFSIPRSENEVVVFDVGHGDSAFFRFGSITCLVDVGMGYTDIANELIHRGISKIDILVVTHAHQDHHGGLEKLLERMNGHVEYVFLTENTAEKYPDVKARIVAADEHYLVKKGADTVTLDLYRFYSASDENDNGICVRFQHDDFVAYEFGDAGKAIIEGMNITEPIDFAPVPHHGSATSVSPSLYFDNPPVFMTVSHSTKYTLPSEAFLRAVEESGVRVISTYYSGCTTYDGKHYKSYLSP